jgi:ABC-type cobalamin/Fe3+-siderophores transport system ATPase subunit
MTALLQLHDVTAGYVADIDILRGVDVSVAEGAITRLIGLNGAGKSTIMKTICGFLQPKSGEIRFDGSLVNATTRVSCAGRAWSPGVVPATGAGSSAQATSASARIATRAREPRRRRGLIRCS